MAQDELADLLNDPASQVSRPDDRARVVARMAEIENTRRQGARDRATRLGLSLRRERPNGRIEASMALPAATGVNSTDNVEQVRISAPPAAGTYQAVVSFSGSLSGGGQVFSLLLSGSSAEPPPPLPLALSSVSPASAYTGPATLDISGTGLGVDTEIKLTRSGQPDIVATDDQMFGSTPT